MTREKNPLRRGSPAAGIGREGWTVLGAAPEGEGVDCVAGADSWTCVGATVVPVVSMRRAMRSVSLTARRASRARPRSSAAPLGHLPREVAHRGGEILEPPNLTGSSAGQNPGLVQTFPGPGHPAPDRCGERAGEGAAGVQDQVPGPRDCSSGRGRAASAPAGWPSLAGRNGSNHRLVGPAQRGRPSPDRLPATAARYLRDPPNARHAVPEWIASSCSCSREGSGASSCEPSPGPGHGNEALTVFGHLTLLTPGPSLLCLGATRCAHRYVIEGVHWENIVAYPLLR